MKHTERLARQITLETDESLTGAIQKALEERWERLQKRRRERVVTGRIEEFSRPRLSRVVGVIACFRQP